MGKEKKKNKDKKHRKVKGSSSSELI